VTFAERPSPSCSPYGSGTSPRVNPLDLWPAVVLTVLPLPIGVCAGFAVDAYLVLRDLRAGRTVDR
jgi:hypothetical protein